MTHWVHIQRQAWCTVICIFQYWYKINEKLFKGVIKTTELEELWCLHNWSVKVVPVASQLTQHTDWLLTLLTVHWLMTNTTTKITQWLQQQTSTTRTGTKNKPFAVTHETTSKKYWVFWVNVMHLLSMASWINCYWAPSGTVFPPRSIAQNGSSQHFRATST